MAAFQGLNSLAIHDAPMSGKVVKYHALPNGIAPQGADAATKFLRGIGGCGPDWLAAYQFVDVETRGHGFTSIPGRGYNAQLRAKSSSPKRTEIGFDTYIQHSLYRKGQQSSKLGIQSNEKVSLKIPMADDHEAVQKGVCFILGTRDDLEVCAEASDGFEALRKHSISLPP
jgi:hypothetical protein